MLVSVQRIGVGCGAAVVVDCGIRAHLDHLAHGGMLGVRRGHVGLLLPHHVEGN